jgi:DNA-binding CsgD family transcriptional regulator
MASLIRTLWNRLRSNLRLEPARRDYNFDAELSLSLRKLAERQQRPEDEVIVDLLKFAIDQHKNNDIYLASWDALTRREQQVTALVCLGYTNTEIGQRLFISPDTVKSHVRHVQEKFGLRGKADLRQALAAWDFSEWDTSDTS